MTAVPAELRLGAEALGRIVNATSVVVVGASDDQTKLAGRTVANLVTRGYQGRIMAVNPSRRTVGGLPCFASVAALPEVPETAFVVSPAPTVVPALVELDQLGVATATIVASGFGEDGTPDGWARGEALRAFVERRSMRVLGPNSIGTLSSANGAVFRATTNLPPAIEPGAVSVVAQSGAISLILLHLLHQTGLGVHEVIPLGNEVDLGIAEAVVHLGLDDTTRCIIAFVESVRHVDAFASAVLCAQERDVQVVAILAGTSATGSAIAGGHTGALATDSRLARALLGDLGVTVVADPGQAVDVARLAVSGRYRRSRPGLAMICLSGGEAAMLADVAEAAGVALPQPEGEVRDRLSSMLRFTTPRNPLDVGADALTNPILFLQAYELLASDQRFGSVAVVLPPLTRFDGERVRAVLAGFPDDGPEVTILAWPVAGGSAAAADEFSSSASFLGAYGRLMRSAQLGRAVELATAHRLLSTGRAAQWLDDDEVRMRAGSVGLPAVRERFIGHVDELAAGVAELPGPWVLKASVRDVPHKSDWGGVLTRLHSAQQVEEGWRRIGEEAERRWPGRFRGAWLQQELTGIEVYVGALRHEVLGPFLAVGRGGTEVEREGSIVFLPLPVSPERLAGTLSAGGVLGDLTARRGVGRVAPEHLVTACEAVAALLEDDAVVSVDANPVFLHPALEGPVAVDVRIAVDPGRVP